MTTAKNDVSGDCYLVGIIEGKIQIWWWKWESTWENFSRWGSDEYIFGFLGDFPGLPPAANALNSGLMNCIWQLKIFIFS